MYNRITQGNCIICLQNCFDLPLEKNVLVVKKKHLKFKAVGQKFTKTRLRVKSKTAGRLFQNKLKPCQDHVCLDHVCQDHVCQVHVCQEYA